MSIATTAAIAGSAARRGSARGRTASQEHPASTARDSESALLERARAGDAAACEKLFAAHVGRAYRLAYRVTGSREDAEDVVQDAFVRCFRALPRHRGEASFSTWVMRIVTNESIRALQKRRRRQPRWFRMVRSRGDRAEGALDRAVEARCVSDTVAECLEQLPPRDRTLLTMRYVEGYSATEIGDLLEQPPGTVRSHLFRARQRLRELLEPHLGSEDVGESP